MIRKLLRRVFSRNSSAPVPSIRSSSAELHIIPREQHGIMRGHINPCALKVTSGLQEAGYSAFVVGGAARDLLLGLEPKDYDVATNATPEEVRAIFRRSRIIGRRFRLVHVMCGAETVEVSTFRGSTSASEDEGTVADAHADEHGRLLRDKYSAARKKMPSGGILPSMHYFLILSRKKSGTT